MADPPVRSPADWDVLAVDIRAPNFLAYYASLLDRIATLTAQLEIAVAALARRDAADIKLLPH